ncbi:ABC-2 family transporter protein [Clostridium pasteurianum DSM 525 = ATCC 6013]|uniref:ABC-2 family transporter protein n=1 Tax=Clostridium pasteurianum DSM 525 = ATCC 6013 TaxID=1262449 RepID=A0A0H3IYH2_CLOPA|nr:ABC-2 transporter permease [Clostridium pasteurianum]AJA46561.1 ABC-2 family transporter protein [Clostridium pasteurianum DSM 525 = ATCC 6013]AJA50549.1 ABC-2 family transporter protein [Clostridium pasteurianum DSM 525 = ATCC 6013]AOZ73985.1 hypothetical protein AQ983_02235 [Clostridium pasteurianum DSM 525 = ATCC 6013]AOZ77782.1 hypothetical protein AQ984_02235 [Clostridium pasteurianum]ELP61133.1 hypothetical protein F502_01720 [Clostridium pasteurianum DSM 525 = ATCC 6013]
MVNLILKDILVQKKPFVFFIVFAVIMNSLYSHMDASYVNVIFIMLPVMIIIGCVTNMSIKDEKAENMINSLPVKRIDIILAKYLSVFIFIFIASIIIFVSSSAMNFMGIIHLERLMNFKDVEICAIITIFISSLYFPINFKLGYTNSRYILMSLYMCIFFIPLAIEKLIGDKVKVTPEFIVYINNAPNWQIVSFVICILAIVMIVSFFISYFLYKNKDLA